MQEDDLVIQKILDCRGQFSTREYLIQWKGLTTQQSTWEPLSRLKNCDTLIKAYHQKRDPLINKSKFKDNDEDEDFNPISEKSNTKKIKNPAGRPKKVNAAQSRQQNGDLLEGSSKKNALSKNSLPDKQLSKADISVEEMFVDQSLQGKIVYLIRQNGILFYRDRAWVLSRCKQALIRYYQSCIVVTER